VWENHTPTNVTVHPHFSLVWVPISGGFSPDLSIRPLIPPTRELYFVFPQSDAIGPGQIPHDPPPPTNRGGAGLVPNPRCVCLW